MEKKDMINLLRYNSNNLKRFNNEYKEKIKEKYVPKREDIDIRIRQELFMSCLWLTLGIWNFKDSNYILTGLNLFIGFVFYYQTKMYDEIFENNEIKIIKKHEEKISNIEVAIKFVNSLTEEEQKRYIKVNL